MYAKPRMPDPVRSAAVRAGIAIALTLVLLMAALLCMLAGAWSALPVTLIAIAAVVVATWSVLDVWITRQVWRQRGGVVSTPRSVARRTVRDARQAPSRSWGDGTHASR
jgi:membrane protein YdbS with pleckstrin-like domain